VNLFSFSPVKMDDGGAGGDGGFDGCECIWSHELATRRLINMIRQTQDYCTDSECLTDGTGGNGGGAGAGNDMGMLFIGLTFLLAIVLFFMRPNRSVPPGKGHDNDGPNFDPPAPTAS